MTGLVQPEADQSGFTLSPHELHLCGDLVGVEQLPVVLGRGPQSPDVESWTASIAEARAELLRRGLLDPAGRVADGLEELLDVLGKPLHEIAARRIGDGGMDRLCLAIGRRGGKVYAARSAAGVDAAVTLGHTESRTASLRAFLGELEPVALTPCSARLRELQEGLGAAEGFTACAHALVGTGIGEAQAGLIAEVLTTTTAFTEIVTISHNAGQTSGTPAAMVVYDAQTGRVIATPHRAPDGELWVTFAPGGWDRVARGIAALDELAQL
ncbi:ESX secretion-associated protein EspG [Tomitella biformata]|uniref:ESX secretion-associated protein EspG n=1 Tax=Tomitella biformata TaxID=630403 RepID=UPI00130DC47B|nr:ESX secretion-associated protein EspG [Tomitella biformata]